MGARAEVSLEPTTAGPARLVFTGVWALAQSPAQLRDLPSQFQDVHEGIPPKKIKGRGGIRFQTTPSGVTLATNRDRTPPLWYSAAEEFGSWALATFAEQGDPQQLKIVKERLESLAVSFIDTFPIKRGQSWIDVETLPNHVKSVAMVVPRSVVTASVGNKINFGRMARQAGVEGVVIPRTFETAAKAIEALASQTKSSSDMVFVKSSTGTLGKEVWPVLAKDLPDFLKARGGLTRHELVQEGVQGLALHNGKKFWMRSWFIVHGGALYVSHYAMAIVFGEKFDSSTSSRWAHADFNHDGVVIDDVKVVTGEPSGAKWIAAIIAAAKVAGPMFASVVAESAEDNLKYHVLGVDAVPQASGSVMFVECNMFADMKLAPPKDRMAFAVLRLLFGVVKGGGEVDDDLTKVWTAPSPAPKPTYEPKSEL